MPEERGGTSPAHGAERIAALTSEARAFYRERGIGARVGFGQRPAVLVVDMSRAFTDPSYLVGSDQTAAVEAIAQLLPVARQCRLPVFFTVIAYTPGGDEAASWAKKIPALLQLRLDDPAAVEIDERIAPAGNEPVLMRKFASAFFGTRLPSTLVAAGIDTVLLTGCSTSGCIRATAVDAVSHGLHVIVPEECVCDRALGPHYANLFDIDAKYGDVVRLEDVLDYLAALRALPHLQEPDG
ncbi:MAG: maleamate amidohydrolase [Solirubrobacteraceae bacterium]|jgi:nicotinamidase-related amidase|nr:maleamate amidohydrolase [Solirubrobacteraceae bacterium]